MKIKNVINRLIGTVFFRRKSKDSGIKMTPLTSHFKEEIKRYTSHMETKTAIYDYQNTINFIYSLRSSKASLKPEEKTTEEDKEKILKEKQRLAQKVDSVTNSNFFNEHSMKILQHTSYENLIDLACKSFVGSIGTSRL